MMAEDGVRVATRYPDVGGESPTYDPVAGRLLWVDAINNWIHEVRWTGDGWTRSPGWEIVPTSGILGNVFSRATGGLLISAGPEFVAISDSGEREDFASPAVGERGSVNILHDGKCDDAGRLVIGWRTPDFTTGGLVRIDPDGKVETLLEHVRCANGLDWSPDGETFYFVDSFAKTVEAFDYDRDLGRLSNRRTIVCAGIGDGVLDGLCTDSEGGLWVAHAYTSEVRRYSPTGELTATVRTPTPLPTSCVFGGPRSDVLFITAHFFTSRAIQPPTHVLREAGVSDAQIDAAVTDTRGGALYMYEPGVSGRVAPAFAG